jgi:uncharacterized RmlC-like cupin family protein
MFTSTTKAKLKATGVMFAGIMTLAVVTNIDLVQGVQDLWKQEGNVIKMVNGGSRTLQVEGTLQTDGAYNSGGLLTTNAGINHSYTNSTSTTATAYTLVLADINKYESVIMTPNVGTVTVTGFASSTATSLVPVAGDHFKQCWYNATTTAGVLITFADGTGTNFNTASSTYNGAEDLSIDAGEMACMTYFREPATATTFDILIGLQKFYND